MEPVHLVYVSTLCRILYDVRRSACLAPFLPILALRATSPSAFCLQLYLKTELQTEFNA